MQQGAAAAACSRCNHQLAAGGGGGGGAAAAREHQTLTSIKVKKVKCHNFSLIFRAGQDSKKMPSAVFPCRRRRRRCRRRRLRFKSQDLMSDQRIRLHI
jgi:hypothetical protein